MLVLSYAILRPTQIPGGILRELSAFPLLDDLAKYLDAFRYASAVAVEVTQEIADLLRLFAAGELGH